MLPFEKALKRLEEKKNYKPKSIDFWKEYLKIFRRRENSLYCIIHNIREGILYNEAEITSAEKEREVVAFLTKVLEDKIFNTSQLIDKAKNGKNEQL